MEKQKKKRLILTAVFFAAALALRLLLPLEEGRSFSISPDHWAAGLPSPVPMVLAMINVHFAGPLLAFAAVLLGLRVLAVLLDWTAPRNPGAKKIFIVLSLVMVAAVLYFTAFAVMLSAPPLMPFGLFIWITNNFGAVYAWWCVAAVFAHLAIEL